jgi:hypothetical protein
MVFPHICHVTCFEQLNDQERHQFWIPVFRGLTCFCFFNCCENQQIPPVLGYYEESTVSLSTSPKRRRAVLPSSLHWTQLISTELQMTCSLDSSLRAEFEGVSSVTVVNWYSDTVSFSSCMKTTCLSYRPVV